MNTEKKFNLKKSNAIALFFIFVLVAVGLVMDVYFFTQVTENFGFKEILLPAFDLVIYIGIIFYAVYGYKVPHSNLLKYIMLGFAIISLVHEACSDYLNITKMILLIFACVGIAYISGRLDRIKQNRIISIIIFALLISVSIIQIINLNNVPNIGEEISSAAQAAPSLDSPAPRLNYFGTVTSAFSIAIQWAAIVFAYLTRYHLHKEVGFQEKY